MVLNGGRIHAKRGQFGQSTKKCDEAPRNKSRRQHQWHSGTPLQATSSTCLETSWQGDGQGAGQRATSVSKTAWEPDHVQWCKAQARYERQPQDLQGLLKSGLHAMGRLRKEAGRRPEGATWPYKASAKAQRKQLKEEGMRNMRADGRKPPIDDILPTGTDPQLHSAGQLK